jgi:hypothetical protein
MVANLTLKYGTIKGWDGFEDGHPARVALDKYLAAGQMLMGAAMQKDNQEQKQALIEIIDAIDGEIMNDWEGKAMTKDEAKDYILSYRT